MYKGCAWVRATLTFDGVVSKRQVGADSRGLAPHKTRRSGGNDRERSHNQQYLVGRQSNHNRPYVNTNRCLVTGVVGSFATRTRYLKATKKPEKESRSAPSKSAKDSPIGPTPVGGDYALLPGGLTLLPTNRTRRIRPARGAF